MLLLKFGSGSQRHGPRTGRLALRRSDSHSSTDSGRNITTAHGVVRVRRPGPGVIRGKFNTHRVSSRSSFTSGIDPLPPKYITPAGAAAEVSTSSAGAAVESAASERGADNCSEGHELSDELSMNLQRLSSGSQSSFIGQRFSCADLGTQLSEGSEGDTSPEEVDIPIPSRTASLQRVTHMRV